MTDAVLLRYSAVITRGVVNHCPKRLAYGMAHLTLPVLRWPHDRKKISMSPWNHALHLMSADSNISATRSLVMIEATPFGNAGHPRIDSAADWMDQLALALLSVIRFGESSRGAPRTS